MPQDLIQTLHNKPDILRHFLDAIGDALFVVNLKHDIVFWNSRAEALTGYAPDEVIGRTCQQGIRCESCKSACGLFDQGELRDVPVTIRHKNGESLNVRKSAFLLRDDTGEVVGGVELLRDETPLLQQMAACQSQRVEIETRDRLHRAILGSIREGILTIDESWRINHFSRRAEALTGIKADDALGKFCHEVIGSTLCDDDCPALHCLKSGDDEAERSTTIHTAGGRPLPIAEIAAPLHDESGKAIGSVLIIDDRSALAGGLGGDDSRFAGMIGRSAPMRQVFRIVEQVAPTDATVLITGQSGTGKERIAQALHRLSARRSGPFVAINCAALPETLLESELFGHVRGAFTGATRDRPGHIEEANGGTLFLDEIGEMPASLQAKLLRFLQEREFQRVGENLTRQADVRIVTATNRDLVQEVKAGRFREDLYYRIKVIPIDLPQLASRREDIPLLATQLLSDIATRRGRAGMSLTASAMARLRAYHWPGNVRELINVLEYAVTLSPSRHIRRGDLPPELSEHKAEARYQPQQDSPADEAERIRKTLAETGGNKTRAAELLGMNRVTLYRKMKRYGMN